MDLSLISTIELLQELQARYETSVFIGAGKTAGSEDSSKAVAQGANVSDRRNGRPAQEGGLATMIATRGIKARERAVGLSFFMMARLCEEMQTREEKEEHVKNILLNFGVCLKDMNDSLEGIQ